MEEIRVDKKLAPCFLYIPRKPGIGASIMKTFLTFSPVAILLLALALALGCGGGQRFGARVDSSALDAVNRNEVYYDISGSTVQELRAQMERRGPVYGGKRMFGRCLWRVRASFAAYPRKPDARCVASKVPARLDATITLPRWRGYDQAPAELKARWDGFIKGLRRHEQNHFNHGQAAAVETKRAIQELSGKYDCQEFQRRAQDILRSVPAAYSDRDREYDSVTNHGSTEFSL